MKNIFALIGFLVVAWFFWGVVQKLLYAAKVERELRKLSIDPAEIEKRVGRANYTNGLYYLKSLHVSTNEAAGLLNLHVLMGYDKYVKPTDPQEIIFLKKLGLLE